MISVHGYYQNGVCVPLEALELENKQRVIITVIDQYLPKSQVPTSQTKRLDILYSLSGILPSTITDEDVKMCRVVK